MERKRSQQPRAIGVSFCLLALVSVFLKPCFAEDDLILRKRVLDSISRAQSYLLESQRADGSWPVPTQFVQFEQGMNSLIVLSLLNSGISPEDPRLARALTFLRNAPDSTKTYDAAMVIQALALAKQAQDVARRNDGLGQDSGKIARLARKLEGAQNNQGAWRYELSGGGDWDNSNTQFALMGLREAALAGVPISQDVWRKAQEHWMHGVCGGGGWTYQTSESGRHAYGSMTVAGIASLSITSAFLMNDTDDVTPQGKLLCCGGHPAEADQAIADGVQWLGRHFSVRANPAYQNWFMYYMYGLERAGRFTGTRLFGDSDWYREGATFLVAGQSLRGSWKTADEPEELTNTSLALLFLGKGLSPVLINKLQWGSRQPPVAGVVNADWNRHPRDASNLVDHISGRPRWPKLLSWQTVDLERAAEAEGIAPLLQGSVQLISGSERPTLSGKAVDLLREYIQQGGFLFAVQNCEGAEFDTGIREIIQQMFPLPELALHKLPSTHDVYRSEHLFNENPPELWGVDFGCRTAIIYAPYDHCCRWRKWMRHDPPNRLADVRTQIDRSMRLGVNVIAYATGRELHDKLENTAPAKADVPIVKIPRSRLSIARLQHTGGWDTASGALRHLQLALAAKGFETAAAPTLSATDPALFDHPLLYMHGRKNFSFTDAERDQLKKYLETGFLFADACCGSQQFDESFRKLIEQLYQQPLQRIPVDHELLKMPTGFDIRQVHRRILFTTPGQAASSEPVLGEPVLEGMSIDGRLVLVYSKYDLSCALERQATVNCAGYPTEDAAKIAVNIVLYALFQ